jgi:WD40 repeat protein
MMNMSISLGPVKILVGAGIVAIACLLAACGRDASTRHPSRPPSLSVVRLGRPSHLPTRVGDDLVTASALTSRDVVLLGTSAGNLYAVDRTKANATPRRLAHLSEKIMAVTSSSDGQFVAAVSVGGSAAVGLVHGLVRVGHLDTTPESVAFDDASDHVAFAGFGVQIYDAITGDFVASYAQPVSARGRSPYDAVAFMKGGQIIAASVEGADRWRAGSPRAIGQTIGCDCAADGVAVTPDGRTVVFGSADGHLVIVDVRSQLIREDRTVSVDPNDHVFAVGASITGHQIAAFAASGRGLIWDDRVRRVTWHGSIARTFPTRVTFASETMLKLDNHTNESDNGTGFGLAGLLVPITRQTEAP